MTRRRALRGVLHNFLSSFTSRYSDHDGYWLMGLLVREFATLEMDLLDHPLEPDTSALARVAVRRARAVWNKQVELGRQTAHVRQASIVLSRHPSTEEALVNGLFKPGYELRLVAHAMSDIGTGYTARRTLLVAPHDPTVEHRSVRR